MKKYDGNTTGRNRKGGFTLVELIVTLAVLAIVLSASVFGILAYQKYANFKRNNEYARTIFAAAQSGLTHYKASGQLEDLQELLKDTGHGVDPALFEVDPEDAESKNVSGDRLVYLQISGGNTSDPFGKALYELLDDYVYDPSVFNASICVEMDVMDGVVYAVCYSDRADDFTYGGAAGSVSGGVMNICDRRESVRKEICLGYYSSALSERAPSSYEKTAIGDVTLVNDELLELQFNMTKKYNPLTNSLLYTVRLFDEEKKLKVSFDLNDKNKSDIKEIDGNLLVGGEDGGNTKITTEVTFYGEDGKPSGDKRKLTFGAYVDKKSVVHLVLDGLDLAADSWTGESKKDTDEGELDETYSIKRLGLDTGKKIYAAVQASGANYKPSAWKNSNSENPYFADSSQTDSEFAVKNARHLFNIRYREGENTVSRYLQKESFAWGGEDGILAAKHVYENGKIVEWSEENVKAFAAVPKLNAGSVYEGSGKKEIAIQELVLGKDLTQESEAGNGGEEQSGSGDSTDAGKNGGTDNGGIAGKAGTGGNEEVTEDITEGGEEDTADPEKTPYGNLGLFCENDGTIRNIVLEHVTVDNAAEVPEENGENVGEEKNGGEKEIAKRESTGLEGALKEGSGPEDTTDLQEAEAEKYGTGALCGVNRGLIEKVTVKGGSVAGNTNVGGIAGKDEALKETSDEALGTVRSYAQLENTARVSGNKNVGGILGYNDGSTLTKCVSAPEMEEADLAELEENIEENLRGTNVGGIVGYSQGGALEECATTGGYVTGKSHVGGIVGLMEVMGGPAGDAADGSEAKAAAADGEGKAAGGEGENISLAVLDGSGLKNRAVVIGEEYVGGITGENQGCLIKNWTNEGLVAASKQYAGGITGYNGETGKIENCRTDVDTSAISGEKQLAGVLQGVITQTLIPDPARMGRFPATEILIGTDAALNLIRENKCHQMNTIMQSGAALGMHSLNMDLTRLVGEGKITREDAMKYSNNKKELLQYL